jgi:pyruvate dehydrogenase E2 component (dihydrolipoamide acetyltransferase)
MPSLGADMTHGRLVEWLVKPGDAVHRGDIVAVVDTSKAEIDVEIFEDGVIGELLIEEGELVPVGTVLATVGAETPSAAPTAPAATPIAPPATPIAPPATRPPAVSPAPAPVPAGDGRVHASPVARRVAEQLGVDLSTLVGTGPHGAISKADVERAAAQPVAERPPAPAPPPERPPHPAPPEGPPAPVPPPPRAPADTHQDAMRQTIAALMARSKREIPHYYLTQDVDMTRALAWLERHNAEVPIAGRLLPAALLLAATARATREFPDFNGFFEDGARRPSERVHLGVAIAMRGGGLIAPAILDADRLTPPELMDALRDLVARTRRGGLRGSELSEPTITVTSLGDQGVTSVLGVIYPPQVAIVGFGRVQERAWAEGGMVGARPLVSATLAADHRVSDGHGGGLFLAAIDGHLQRPEEL